MSEANGSFEIQLEFLIDVDAIYDELSDKRVDLRTLDQIDPEYIVDKVVECRNHITKATDIYRRVSREKSRMENLEATIETQFEILKDSRLANDSGVQRGSSIEDRKAIIHTDLVELRTQLRTAKARTKEISNLEKVVTTIIKNLENVSKDIDKQRKVMELQMHELNRASVRDASMIHLNKSFNEIREFEKAFDTETVLASDQSGIVVNIPDIDLAAKSDAEVDYTSYDSLADDPDDETLPPSDSGLSLAPALSEGIDQPTVEMEGEALPPSDSGFNPATVSEVDSITTEANDLDLDSGPEIRIGESSDDDSEEDEDGVP